MAITDNYILKTLDSINKKDWDQFVYNHPHGNIFQTSDMYEVFKRTKNYEPIALAVLNESGNIFALTQAHVIKEINGPLGTFTSRSVMIGGPLYIEGNEGKESLKILMEHYNKIAKKKTLYTQIRNSWDTGDISNIMINSGYKYEDHLNFLTNLKKSRDELWNNLHRGKKRGISKGYKSGCLVEEIQDINSIKQIYKVLMDTYLHAKLPLADISLFESVFQVLYEKNYAKFWITKHDNKIIGMCLVLIYRGILSVWYLGAFRNALKFHPTELLSWHVIEWGSTNNYQTFDFCGAGKPNESYGVREFKSKFGGDLVNYGRYMKIHSPIKYNIAKTGFEIYRKL
jgi:serine/alanine adding enzyme